MKILLISLGGIGLLVVAGIVAAAVSGPVQMPLNSTNVVQTNAEVKEKAATQKPVFEVLNHHEEGGTQPLIKAALLVDGGSEAELKTLVNAYREQECTIQCNIEVWDDRKAFEMQKKIDDLITEGLAADKPINIVFTDQEIEAQRLSVENCEYIGNHSIAFSSTFDAESNYLELDPLKQDNCAADEQMLLDKYLEGNEKVKDCTTTQCTFERLI
jgi:hypothetical protein